jgi:hypothetical protein
MEREEYLTQVLGTEGALELLTNERLGHCDTDKAWQWSLCEYCTLSGTICEGAKAPEKDATN